MPSPAGTRASRRLAVQALHQQHGSLLTGCSSAGRHRGCPTPRAAGLQQVGGQAGGYLFAADTAPKGGRTHPQAGIGQHSDTHQQEGEGREGGSALCWPPGLAAAALPDREWLASMIEVRESIWQSSGARRPSARTPQNRGCCWEHVRLLRGQEGSGGIVVVVGAHSLADRLGHSGSSSTGSACGPDAAGGGCAKAGSGYTEQRCLSKAADAGRLQGNLWTDLQTWHAHPRMRAPPGLTAQRRRPRHCTGRQSTGTQALPYPTPPGRQPC